MQSYPFPLPRAPQECYSKWYNMKVETGTFKGYTVLWVGSQLSCRFKSETINDNIGPHNVFILKKSANQFVYCVIDNTDTMYSLPKRFFTTCFPGVQYNHVPTNNLIKIKITKDDTIEVPYIPKAFLQQKRKKTSRAKRKRSVSESTTEIEKINFNTTYPEWHVLTNNQNTNKPIHKEILILIRQLMLYADRNDIFEIENPFQNISTLNDLKNDQHAMKILKTVTGFIYHFCRSELGCSIVPNNVSSNLQTWIGHLSNTATV